MAPYLQPRGPSIPPPLSATVWIEILVQNAFCTRLSGWSFCSWAGRAVLCSLSPGDSSWDGWDQRFWNHQDNWRRLYKDDTGKWGMRRGGNQRHRGAFASLRALCDPWLGLLIPGCGQGQPGVVGGVPWNGMDFEVLSPIHPLHDISDTTELPNHLGTSTWMA